MKVKQLIEHLQNFDPNLEVFVYADHGQMPQKASIPQMIYLEDQNHYMTEDYTTYEEEADEYDYTDKAVLI